jgi:NitT/TauT family transport system substrate-binding protein
MNMLNASCRIRTAFGCFVAAISIGAASAQNAPSFSLAWSEYPSWSAFGVASEVKLIDGKRGALGTIEKKWNVDIELKEADYESCLVMYGAGNVDAVCITNMDVLNPSLGLKSVAVLPTSTSFGADALIVPKSITDVKQMKGKKVYGLAQTVSEYCFVRNLEELGENPAEYSFTNMDPAAAAVAMQQKQPGFDAIVVWNPFVLQTLKNRPDTHVLFDSTKIPGEIIDMVVASEASLAKPGGKAFACAVIDAYYGLNVRLNAPETRNDTLIAIGEKFSDLNLEEMKKATEQTKFYGTAEAGLEVLAGGKLPQIMEKVVGFCVKAGIVPNAPKLAYGPPKAGEAADLRFDPSYIQAVTAKRN